MRSRRSPRRPPPAKQPVPDPVQLPPFRPEHGRSLMVSFSLKRRPGTEAREYELRYPRVPAATSREVMGRPLRPEGAG